MVVFWGEQHLAFYNDAYRPTIGDKHPAVIGQAAHRHWAETWDVLGPLLDGVRRTGVPYRGENHPFVLNRHGFLEDVSSTSRTTRSATSTAPSAGSSASSTRPPGGCSASAGCAPWPSWATSWATCRACSNWAGPSPACSTPTAPTCRSARCGSPTSAARSCRAAAPAWIRPPSPIRRPACPRASRSPSRAGSPPPTCRARCRRTPPARRSCCR
ncbi:hypothetical protein V2I01_23125 [Micromonospora sp. BRA006-A]|nr:hypothetical protein [Micromonospora sp. BRA006-A]